MSLYLPNLTTGSALGAAKPGRGDDAATATAAKVLAPWGSLATAAVLAAALTGPAPALAAPDQGVVAFTAVDQGEDTAIFGLYLDETAVAPLADTPDADSRPTWSPDGSRLAFQGGGIQVLDIDTRAVTPVAAGAQPAWSPDGTQIAFTVGTGIHVVGAAGGADRTLTQAPPEYFEVQPAFSPDGTRIAWLRVSDHQQQLLMVMNADGSQQRALLPATATSSILSLEWSPDGQRLVFNARGGDDLDDLHNLYVVNRDGSGLRELADELVGEAVVDPTWSPDGQRIAFGAGSVLYSVGADGSGLTTLVEGTEPNRADWSPDGQSIVYVEGASMPGDFDEPSDLWLLDASGGSARQVTSLGTATEPEFAPAPAPQPGPGPVQPAPGVTRVDAGGSGNVRAVATALCQHLAPADDSALAVLLARDDVFADALAGAPLAGPDSCVLFTQGGPDAALDPAVRAEIDRALPDGGVVRLLGGQDVVSVVVARELADAGYIIERYAGPTRFETAIAVARKVRQDHPDNTQALVAYGLNWPDAVTGGAYGAASDTPILLTPAAGLHQATDAALDELGTTHTVVVGGAAVVSEAAMAATPDPERIAGPNRMATAVAIADLLWTRLATDGQRFVVANVEHGQGWTLALAAAPLSAALGAPQLGVGNDRYPAETSQHLRSRDFQQLPAVLVVGGMTFVSQPTVEAIDTDIQPQP